MIGLGQDLESIEGDLEGMGLFNIVMVQGLDQEVDLIGESIS
jgi:hypothetical protein